MGSQQQQGICPSLQGLLVRLRRNRDPTCSDDWRSLSCHHRPHSSQFPGIFSPLTAGWGEKGWNFSLRIETEGDVCVSISPAQLNAVDA